MFDALIQLLSAIIIIIGGIFLVILYFIFLSALMSFPVWILWNWLTPILFHGALPQLTWLQSWGLLFLCSCLFKSPATSAKTSEKKQLSR
jgi:hypothetical protein